MVLAALSGGTAVALGVRWLLDPAPPLSKRVRPYTLAARVALGRAPDVAHLEREDGGVLRRLVTGIGSWLDRRGPDALALRLRQAGWYPEADDAERIERYRMRATAVVALGAGIGLALGAVTGMAASRALAVAILGGIVGAGRHRGALARAIEERRRRMRIEIYTIDQILALRIRAGGSPVHAVQSLVERGRGEVVSELAEVLRMHRAGLPAAAAFRRVAALTPEPFCARSYLLLAAGEERGADLAAGLMALAEDGREARREALRRGAVRRRAAMLVPTIAILAPVMLLFVGAPLPYLVLNWR